MTEDVFCSLEEYMKSLGLDHQTLAGIPPWMAAAGVVAIIVFSHWFVNARQGLPTTRRYGRFNLLSFAPLKRLVRRPYFPILMQSVSLFLFLLILTAGLFGNQQSNIAPVLTWTWWWALLIFLVLGLGQTFCMICPWEALSSLVTSLSLKSRIKKLGFERPWPKWARYMYPAIAFFILLTWFELGNDVTRSPSLTAIMALFMMGMAVLTAIVFEKRAFCRNACLVGRITGLYSLFSPVEVRPQSHDVCLKCTTKDCHRGNDHATGCPTNLFPGHLKENTYCTLCTECVRACPHDNLALNVRTPAADLLHKDRFQWDEAILAVVLLALTSFHGFTMTPLWTRLNNVLRVETGWGPTVIFTALMILMVVAPIVLFWIGAQAASWLTRRKNPTPPAAYARPGIEPRPVNAALQPSTLLNPLPREATNGGGPGTAIELSIRAGKKERITPSPPSDGGEGRGEEEHLSRAAPLLNPLPTRPPAPYPWSGSRGEEEESRLNPMVVRPGRGPSLEPRISRVERRTFNRGCRLSGWLAVARSWVCGIKWFSPSPALPRSSRRGGGSQSGSTFDVEESAGRANRPSLPNRRRSRFEQAVAAIKRVHASLLAGSQRLNFAAAAWPFGLGASGRTHRSSAGHAIVPPARIFKAFAYALIPVALFYHLAHNCMHFFLEAGRLIPLLSDPFGWGWNLFGTAGRTYGPLLSLETIWILQVVCIVVGHVYGVVIADRVAKRLFERPLQVALGLIPLLITMILYSCFSIWLISQPMDMKTAM